MNAITNSIEHNIDQFIGKFLAKQQQETGKLPVVDQDQDWISPCEVGTADDDGMIQWQPTAITETLSFANVEDALGFEIHPDLKTYFTHCYSESIPACSDKGNLELLFAWNKDDFDRLQKNMIGHVLMKQKLKQQVTLFFAVTDEDDINLVIKNDTGEVWIEPVGCEPKECISPDIATFIASLQLNA